MAGLSERDRRRLERGRESAAVKLARERMRIEKAKARAAITREREAEERARLGPLEVVGPDGAAVGLVVRPSGGFGLIFSIGTGDWIDLVAGLALLLANLFSHWVLFRGGSTVHVSAPGRKRVKIRLRSQTVAAACLREIADEVRHNGLLALDRRPICSCASRRGTEPGRTPAR